MSSIEALANIGQEVKRQEIDHDSPIVAELLDYIRWLAEQDTGFRLTAGQVWELFHEGVRLGRAWSEVCHDLGLPERESW